MIDAAAAETTMTRRCSLTIPVLCVALSGCGLLFGNRQVNVSTEPPGAWVHSGNSTPASAPGTIDVRTKEDYAIVRATLSGYEPACVQLACQRNVFLTVLSSLPAAIPLLIDKRLGTLSECSPRSIRLHLHQIEAEAEPYALPPNDAVLLGSDLCSADERRRAQAAEAWRTSVVQGAQISAAILHILVTAGGITVPYDPLGNVDVGIAGFDWQTFASIRGVGFGSHTFSKATPEDLNGALRVAAFRRYGDKVDAVINVAYQDNPKNDVFATGLAVHFTTAGLGHGEQTD